MARELENPYCTVPNDLPLNNFQAQFNESLLCMYAGFHPDSWAKEEKADDDGPAQRTTASLDASAIHAPPPPTPIVEEKESLEPESTDESEEEQSPASTVEDEEHN